MSSLNSLSRDLLIMIVAKTDMETVSNLVFCSKEIARKIANNEYWDSKKKGDSEGYKGLKGLKGYIFRCFSEYEDIFNPGGNVAVGRSRSYSAHLNNKSLEQIDILKEIRLVNLTQLYLFSNLLETFPDLTDYNTPNLEILYLNNNFLFKIPKLKLSRLRQLLLSSNLITIYNLEDLKTPSLELLTLENNQNPYHIENKPVNLTSLISLKEIRVSGRQKLFFSKMNLSSGVKITYEN